MIGFVLVRESTVHHLHPVLIRFRLLLCPLLICKGAFLLSGASLDNTEYDDSSEEQHTTANGAGEDHGACGLGQGVPAARHPVWSGDFLENGGVTAARWLVMCSFHKIPTVAYAAILMLCQLPEWSPYV
jgi:hypothetical protein